MPLEVGTHSGAFHADDVLALALIREFKDQDATVVRTRDLDRLAECDVVIDVGGVFDPKSRRFDHHQHDYHGELSSAGMVLRWLRDEGAIPHDVATALKDQLVEYVDAVDNGRRTPKQRVPCFANFVGAITQCSDGEAEIDDWYLEAVKFAQYFVRGMVNGYERVRAARATVADAMDEAYEDGRSVLFFDEYLPWKPAYFSNGGRDHPTEFALFPSDGKWRVVAIPPEPGSYAQKRPLPSEWAGLTGDALSDAVGVAGAVFCHKNRFIAVFETRDAAIEALERWDLMEQP